MKRRIASQLAAILVAIGFGLFVLQGALTSSDFPRGIKAPPPITTQAGRNNWPYFAQLHQNQVENYRGAWDVSEGYPLETYLQYIYQNGLKAVLMNADYNQLGGSADSLPYLVEHFSWGQYEKMQVDWDYDMASIMLDSLGTGYYHFHYPSPAQVQPLGEDFCVYCPTNYPSPGKFLYGAERSDHGDLYEPFYNYPNRGGYANLYIQTGRKFRTRVRMAIDTTGCNVSLSDTVLDYRMLFRFYHTYDSSRVYHLYRRVSDFAQNVALQEFWVEGQLDTSAHDTNFCGIGYEFYTTNKARLYVDWVEYMDMEIAYPLVWNDSSREATIAAIRSECRELLGVNYAQAIVGWNQSNEPWRMTYRAHGIVNDSLAADDSLRGHWPQTALNVSGYKRPDHFVNVAHPRIFEIDSYIYADPDSDTTGTHYLGSQIELDSLAYYLNWCAAVCPDTVLFEFTGSVTYWPGATRHPKGSEIFAQAYMALAHGAKGVNFYKYTSDASTGSQGLVNTSYQHPAGTIYDEKWLAVQHVFAVLDTIGDTLLLLERDAAYCAKNGGFISPITDVYFTDDTPGQDYIEIGQFHLPPSTSRNYLIIVNRRTDADRHITVITNKESTWALRDMYTQERFVSSTGDFKAIPFDAGQGRVFRLEKDEN